MRYWAMRTSRNEEGHRTFLHDELQNGRLRQGWGWEQDQNLDLIKSLRQNGGPVTPEQDHAAKRRQDLAARHRRMGNDPGAYYMQIGDLVVVPNMPTNGLFTICRVTGNYYFEVAEIVGKFKDFGHVRPVEVLTPLGVANQHDLVHADLRRSFRCRSRLWNINSHRACLEDILQKLKEGVVTEDELTRGATPVGRVKSVISDLISKQLEEMATQVGETLSKHVRAEEWEPVLRLALEPLFRISVHHTGGPGEQGADIEVVISNPFEEDMDWIIPVQVKDHDDQVHSRVANQLEKALKSRKEKGRVIAVVLLVSNADASKALEKRMHELSCTHGIPFVFCGRDRFLHLLAEGFVKRS